jgi:hypothetical protein
MTLLFNLLSCIEFNDEMPKIKEIWIYDYFEAGGFTTAGALGQFREFQEKNVLKFQLSQPDVDSLCYIIVASKSKKSFQTKVGQNILFIEFVTENNMSIRAIICQNGAIDTFNQVYLIENVEHQQWLSEFTDRMIASHLKE